MALSDSLRNGPCSNACLGLSKVRQGFCGIAERGERLQGLLEPANNDAGPRDSVHSVQMYEAEHLVVTGQQTGAITLWDLRSGSAVHRILMQDPGVRPSPLMHSGTVCVEDAYRVCVLYADA